MTKLFTNTTLENLRAEAVDIGDHTLYLEKGQNSEEVEKTFILSHGAFGTGEFMKVVAAEIFQSIPNSRIIILDLPWHGRSIASEVNLSNATVHTYADVVEGLIQELRKRGDIQGKFHWIGWSMGGSIGMLLDLRGIGFDELTILNSSPVWYSLQGVVNAVPDMLNPEAIKAVYHNILEGDMAINISEEDKEEVLGHFDKLTATGKVMVQDAKGVLPGTYDIVDEVGNIQAKSLIFSGEKDPLVEMKYLELLEKEIPNSRLVITNDNHLQLVKRGHVQRLVEEINTYFAE